MITNQKLSLGQIQLDYLSGEPHRTRVTLINDDGASYPVFFDAEAINKSESELLSSALDVVYEKNFPNRAEQEKFQTIEEKIELLEERALSKFRIGENKEVFLKSLVRSSEETMVQQGILRNIKKNSNKYTTEELIGILNQLLSNNFQLTEILRSVVSLMN